MAACRPTGAAVPTKAASRAERGVCHVCPHVGRGGKRMASAPRGRTPMTRWSAGTGRSRARSDYTRLVRPARRQRAYPSASAAACGTRLRGPHGAPHLCAGREGVGRARNGPAAYTREAPALMMCRARKQANTLPCARSRVRYACGICARDKDGWHAESDCACRGRGC